MCAVAASGNLQAARKVTLCIKYGHIKGLTPYSTKHAPCNVYAAARGDPLSRVREQFQEDDYDTWRFIIRNFGLKTLMEVLPS